MRNFKLFSFLLVLLASQFSYGYDFKVDEIEYNIIGNTNEVSIADVPFSGALTIPSTVTYKNKTYDVVKIEAYAFRNNRTTTLTIGSKLRDLGNLTSSECSNFTYFVVDEANATFASEDGVLFNKEKSILIMYPCGSSRTSYSVPQSVKQIKGESFCYSSLVNVIFGNSVTYIGEYAFAGCDNLVHVALGDSVKSMGYRTFRYCDALETFSFGKTITEIPEDVFDNCGKLRKVEIPASVTSVGGDAFRNCTSLDSIILYCSTPPSVDNSSFSGVSRLAAVIVPCGTLDDYNNASGWSNFLAIEESSNFIFSFSAISENVLKGSVTITQMPECGVNAEFVAQPNPGYKFQKWSDGNTDNPRSLIVKNNIHIKALFIPQPSQITVLANNDLFGMVSGGGLVEYGASTIINATPFDHYHFVKWSDGNTDNPRTLIAKGDSILIAEFAINKYSLTILSSNESQGFVSGSGIYDAKSIVTITAAPNNSDYIFKSWSDKGSFAGRKITLLSDSTIIASFTSNVFNCVEVAVEDEAQGSADILIQATANKGYTFSSWSDGEVDNPRIVTNMPGLYTAIFTSNSPTKVQETTTQTGITGTRKIILNDALIIIKDGKQYNAQGMVIE